MFCFVNTQAIIYADIENCLLFWICKVLPCVSDRTAYFLYNKVLFHRYFLLLVVPFHMFYFYYVFFVPNYLANPNDPEIIWPFMLTAWTAGLWAYLECITLNFKIIWGVVKSFDFWIKAYYASQLMICGMIVCILFIV